jgi:hypothetical protein
MVDLIMSCPGANVPQGGSANQPNPATPCQGSGSGATLNFPAPNSLSIPSAGLILHDTASNWSKVGGQSVAAQSQQRVTGSGTRITECFNVFGPGADSSCLNSTTAGAASSSGVMENDICGPSGGSPVDPAGAIGYTSRATILVSAQTGAPANTPLSACGIVNQGGSSGWNGTCDGSQTPNNTPGAIARGGGIFICPGDNDVANGNYVVWGYEHFDTGSGEVSTDPSSLYLTWLTSFAQNITQGQAVNVRQQGFMNNCEMNVARTFDAGPYSLATSTC